MTIAVTGSFILWEMVEAVRAASAAKVVLIAVNAAIAGSRIG